VMNPNTFFFLVRMREGRTPESKIGVGCPLVDLLQTDILGASYQRRHRAKAVFPLNPGYSTFGTVARPAIRRDHKFKSSRNSLSPHKRTQPLRLIRLTLGTHDF
jgi:hypothetical protein